MELKDIRIEKSKLRNAIQKLVDEFAQKTEVPVLGIEFIKVLTNEYPILKSNRVANIKLGGI